jgi:hypothetical protein
LLKLPYAGAEPRRLPGVLGRVTRKARREWSARRPKRPISPNDPMHPVLAQVRAMLADGAWTSVLEPDAVRRVVNRTGPLDARERNAVWALSTTLMLGESVVAVQQSG